MVPLLNDILYPNEKDILGKLNLNYRPPVGMSRLLMSRMFVFKLKTFQRISLSRDEADKYKTALRHIGLVANKMQPKQKGQVGVGHVK